MASIFPIRDDHKDPCYGMGVCVCAWCGCVCVWVCAWCVCVHGVCVHGVCVRVCVFLWVYVSLYGGGCAYMYACNMHKCIAYM